MARGMLAAALCCLILGITTEVSGQLLAHWPLDEGINGTTPDESGNGNDLQLGGGVRFVEGHFGQAASFDGEDANEDSIYAEDDIDLFDPGAESLTVTVWTRQGAGASSQNYEFVVSKGNSTSGVVGWSIWTESGSLLVRCNSSNTSAQRASQRLPGWPSEEWGHVALVLDREAAQVRGYLNGSNEGWVAGGGGPPDDSLAGWGDIATDTPLVIGHRSDGQGTLLGEVDDVRVYAGALSEEEIQATMAQLRKEQATSPMPEDGASDVLRDTALGWTAGEFAAAHDVYLGTSLDDVTNAERSNPPGVLVSEGQTDTRYEPPAVLEFGRTYYWRVDEVNAAPDNTIFKGTIWSFTVEPFAYPITGIVATSNAVSNEGNGPERTVDGSGLNERDEHSVDSDDMWLATGNGVDPVRVQYAFERVYKLHELLVWNYNVMFEPVLGFGLKDVTIEYSVDGAAWTTLGDFEFAQATATADYVANTTVDLAGVAAQYVRLTVNSGYGVVGQLGLSEVRFLQIPTFAREPQPAAGAAGVSIDSALSWRAGREVASHEVYFAAGQDVLPLVDTVGESLYAPGALALGTTYTWRIDEVNEAETPGVWEGDVWEFTTEEYLVVDDFERYDDEDNPIFDTWLDGFVNGTRSTVGYFEAPFAERSIVHGGRQSMPLEYINDTAPFYSETERDAGDADWTVGGANTLRLFVQGQADNGAGTLYVALADAGGNVAVVTHPDTVVLTTDAWQEWTISFDDFGGVNMAAVRTIYLGVGDRDNPSAGGAGLIYIDDIQFGRPAIVE